MNLQREAPAASSTVKNRGENMSNKKSNFIITLISFLIVALLVVVAVGVILKYTNGGNESFKTFYVQYGSDKILSTDTEKQIKLESEKLYYFEVGYPLDVGKEEPRDYSVSVVPNVKNDFDFTADGEYLSWKGDVPELSQYFGLKKSTTSFTLYVSENTSLQTILQGVYEGKTVNSPTVQEIGSEYLYTLMVSSYNGKITYKINLALNQIMDGGNIEDGEGTPTPQPPIEAEEFLIGSMCFGQSSSFPPVRINCPSSAKAREEVYFTVEVIDIRYIVLSVSVSILGGESDGNIIPLTTISNESYSFIMPDNAVFITIIVRIP